MNKVKQDKTEIFAVVKFPGHMVDIISDTDSNELKNFVQCHNGEILQWASNKEDAQKFLRQWLRKGY